MSEKRKAGDTAWVWDFEKKQPSEIVLNRRNTLGNIWSANGLDWFGESRLHRTADECWQAHIGELGRKSAEASNELYAVEDAYTAWQAQQKGGGE